jgi:plasmid stability protein
MATLNIKNLSDSLYQKLRERAKGQHRSVAQEVTHILANALGETEARSILELQGLGKETWAAIEATEHVERERGSWD